MQRKLVGLDIRLAHLDPIEQPGALFRSVAYSDALSLAELTELEHALGQGLDGLLGGLVLAFEHPRGPAGGLGMAFHDEVAEAGHVGRDGRHAEREALHRCVAPGLVGAGKDAQVAPTDELVVLHAPERVGGADELGVVHDLDAVIWIVAQPGGADLTKDLVARVALERVRDDAGPAASTESRLCALEPEHPVLLGHRIERDAALACGGAEELGAQAVQTNVADDGDVQAMIAATLEAFGKIDILINNAGTTHLPTAMEDVSEEDFDKVFTVNCKSVYLTAKHIVPLMKKQGSGAILNVASTAGVSPRPRLNWYNASKGWMNTATKAMAVELALLL